MATILFDIVSAKGHIHATLKIASLLKGAGHAVMYSLYVEYWQEVEKHGFQPTVVVSTYPENRLKSFFEK